MKPTRIRTPFEWIGPPEGDLALDVDDLAAAKAHAGGDPDRPAERRLAELADGQRIDLPDHGRLGREQERATIDRLEHVLADP